jgi:multidrug efflux pump subunit AcrA (membrane-fusion protein)
MARKIILLVLLAGFGFVAADAFSQGTTTPSGGSASDKNAQPAERKPPVKPADVSPSPSKSDVPAYSRDKKEKDSSPSKTFPTSSVSQPSSAAPSGSRTQLVIPDALVTLIHDNKLPASEAGMIVDLPVEEGASVEADEIVAQIDSRSTLAKQNIAKAELEAAKAQAANNAEIEVAESAIEVSKADLDANAEIRKTNPRAVSATEERKYKFQYEKSIAQKKQAVNEKDIAGLTANAKKAQHDAATIELDLRQARAPFKGQVVEIMKKKGDWVTAGDPIMHIVGLDQVRVKGFVQVSGEYGASQDDVIGKPVTITVDSAGGKKHTAKGIVRFASPVIEGVAASRHFRIWADVDNEKTVDPVTGQESWKIQPGSPAKMNIDLMPPKPLTKSEPAKGKGKVDAFKPVTPEAEKSRERER